jgi:hypothetical protein
VLSTGLLAGLAMNIFGWLGNQLWLGAEWDAAIAGSTFASNRVRTLWNEVGSLAPDFVYGLALATPLLGTANASLVPWRVTMLTLLLALAIMLPVSEFVWRRLRNTVHWHRSGAA